MQSCPFAVTTGIVFQFYKVSVASNKQMCVEILSVCQISLLTCIFAYRQLCPCVRKQPCRYRSSGH